MSEEKRTIDVYCSECNFQVASEEIYTHYQSEPQHGGVVLEPYDTPHAVTEFTLSKCSRCEGIFLTFAQFYQIPGEVYEPQSERELLYPSTKRLDISILPDSIKKSYVSSTGSFNAGLYEPCVIMCRKTVEALCHEKGAPSGNLKKRIDYLRSSGLIDSKLHTWATGLRLVGNDAAHDLEVEIAKEDASDSLEFLDALLLYCYVLDAKYNEFQARRTN